MFVYWTVNISEYYERDIRLNKHQHKRPRYIFFITNNIYFCNTHLLIIFVSVAYITRFEIFKQNITNRFSHEDATLRTHVNAEIINSHTIKMHWELTSLCKFTIFKCGIVWSEYLFIPNQLKREAIGFFSYFSKYEESFSVMIFDFRYKRYLNMYAILFYRTMIVFRFHFTKSTYTELCKITIRQTGT